MSAAGEGLTGRDDRQRALHAWAVDTFGSIANDSAERGRRFLEEALELAQAVGAERDEALALVDRVFGREPGEIGREVGQCGLTLLSLAEQQRLSADDEEAREVHRVTSLPPEHFRTRHDAKAAAGLALPSNKASRATLNTAEKWNEKYPAGTTVRVKLDNGREEITSTRSLAWMLGEDGAGVGGHTAVVLVLVVSGAVRLDRVIPLVPAPRREAGDQAGMSAAVRNLIPVLRDPGETAVDPPRLMENHAGDMKQPATLLEELALRRDGWFGAMAEKEGA